MENSEAKEKVSPGVQREQPSAKNEIIIRGQNPSARCHSRRNTGLSTSYGHSNTKEETDNLHHRDDKITTMEISISNTDEPQRGISGNGFPSEAHKGGCHPIERYQSRYSGPDHFYPGAGQQTSSIQDGVSPNQENEIRHLKSPVSDPGTVFPRKTRIYRYQEAHQGRNEDTVHGIHHSPGATSRIKNSILSSDAHTTLRTRSSTVLQLSQMEPHDEAMQITSQMLPLRQSRSKGCLPTLRVLHETRTSSLHQLPGGTQPSIQRLPLQTKHRVLHTREDGSRTAEEKLHTHAHHKANHSPMEVNHTSPLNGQPLTSRLPTPDQHSSNTTDNKTPRGNSTHATRYSSDSNSHSYTGTHDPPHENRGDHQRTHQISSQGTLRQSRTRPEKRTQIHPARSNPSFRHRHSNNLVQEHSKKSNEDTRRRSPSKSPQRRPQIPNTSSDCLPPNNQDTRPDTITIISWNIRGFHSNKNLLLAAVQERTPEVIILQETLTRENRSVKIPGYIIYHKPLVNNANTVARGLITAIRSDIPHNPIPCLTSSSHWETLTVELQGFNNGSMHLVNTYVSPTHLFDMKEAISNFKNFLLLGDFNANSEIWGSHHTKPGQHLQEQLINSTAVMLNEPNVPTSIYGSTLDLAIASPQVAAAAEWYQLDELTSDHIATGIEITNSFKKTPDTHRPPRWIIEKANWTLFAEKLHTLSLKNTNQALSLDQLLQSLSQDLNEAATAAIPLTKPKDFRGPRSFLPPEAKQWTREISRLTKLFKANPTEQNKTELRAVQQEARKQLFIMKNQQWEHWCTKLGNMNSTQLWKEIKKIKGHSTSPKVTNPEKEANELAIHFTTRANQDTLPTEVKTALDKQQSRRRDTIHKAKNERPDTDLPFSLHELNVVLRKNRKSAPGEDKFTYSFYTNSPPAFRKRLLEFINQSWIQGKLPEEWKTAVVVPIPKPGGRGHRPISLLPTLSKIMERLILARLLWKLPRPKNLFGFTKGRSTVDAILHLVNLITARRKRRSLTVYAAFMDLDKAFERADHLAILDSLASLGIKGRLITWIEDFLTNRKMKVTFQGIYSDLHNLTTGSPQGSALSPTLFNALVILLLSISLPKSVDIIGYADDLAIISHGTNAAKKLQSALDTTATTANALGLFFSPTKTKIMKFNANSQQSNNFHLGQQRIESVKMYKYLGVVIDPRLSFIKHADEVKRKVYVRLNMIKIISNIKLGITTKMLINLYKALIQSVLLYAAPILLMASQTAMKSLEVAQRTTLRYILGLPSSASSTLVHQESGVPPLEQIVRRDTAKYILRTATKTDPVLNITRVQTEIQKDPRVHKDISWSIRAARLQKSIGIPPIQPPESQEPPPWQDPPLHVIIDNPINKNQNPIGASKAAVNRILNLNDTQIALNIYTDASAQQDGKTAWACYVEEEDQVLQGRLPDNTPITLAELHAIEAALTWRVGQDRPESTLIHSDSMAALTILSTPSFKTYPEIVSKIVRSATALKLSGRNTTIHWVPSHINIEGNERADTLANEATNLDVILHAEQTPGGYSHLIAQYFSKQLHLMTAEDTSPLQDWYQKTIVPGLGFIPNRLADTQLRRLRCWVYTRNFTEPNKTTICPHCQQDFNPVHYLVSCPAYPACRQRLKDQLTPEQHTWTDREKAALLIRKSAIIPHIIIPLLNKDPYTFHSQK